MAVNSDIPQINSLRMAVEKTAGFRMHTHSDFLSLVDIIDNSLHEHISETTLERLWRYSTRKYNTVSLRTLDVLADYAGYVSWDSFCDALREESFIESEEIEEVLYADSLELGQRVKISWLPDRTIIVKYLGNDQFVTMEAYNSKIKKGDTFLCNCFILGQELHLDKLKKGGKEGDGELKFRYIVGRKNGITNLEVLSSQDEK